MGSNEPTNGGANKCTIIRADMGTYEPTNGGANLGSYESAH